MSYSNRNNDYYEPRPDLEESTPWTQLKTGISQKYQNPEDDEDMLFIDDEERFNIRERNYKEFLKNKDEKVVVESKWDSFGESDNEEEVKPKKVKKDKEVQEVQEEEEITEEVIEVKIKKDKKRKISNVEEVELEEESFVEEKVKSKKNKKSKREGLEPEEVELEEESFVEEKVKSKKNKNSKREVPVEEPETVDIELEEESFVEEKFKSKKNKKSKVLVEEPEPEVEETPITKKKNKKTKKILDEETSEIVPEDIEEVPEIILKKKDNKSKKQKIEVQEEEQPEIIIEPEVPKQTNNKRKFNETQNPSKKKNKKPNNKERKLLRKEQYRLAALNSENGETEPIEEFVIKTPKPQPTFQIKPQIKQQQNSQLSVQEEVSSADKGKTRCFGCRAFGHNLKQCKAPTTQAENICIKCGSKDHDYKRCYVHKGPVYNFAVCFSCKKMGHITSQCREKTNGIYPDGGNCRHCQSVDHLGVNCPQNRRRFDSRRGNSNNRFVRNGKTERRKY